MNATRVPAGDLLHAWGRIVSGHRPNLSIEITRECPLRCPGCYAYGDEHLGGGGVTLRGKNGTATLTRMSVRPRMRSSSAST